MKNIVLTTTSLITIIFAIITINSCKEDLPIVEIGSNNIYNAELTSLAIGGNYCEIQATLVNYNSKLYSETGFCWNTTGNPTIHENKNISSVTGETRMDATINNLLPSTKYYIKSYVIHDQATAYSNQIEITTSNGLANISTSDVSEINATSAKCGGNISDNGGFAITSRGVCWNTSNNPTISDNKTVNNTGTGSFTSIITGLSVNTTYYVRAYATNANGIVYGNVKNFTTENGLPTLTTNEIIDITATTAISGGNIGSDGGFLVTARGVCWSTTSNPTITANYTSDGSGIGTFSSNLTGLTEFSTYYVRAYAINNIGTAYGEVKSFTAIPEDLIAYYPFNGNANDESGNNNNGTVIGAILTNDRFGNENSAYYFDGSGDYIDINQVEISINYNQTINIWVNSEDKGTSASYIFDNSEYSNYERISLINSSANTLHVLRVGYNGSSISRGTPDYDHWEMLTIVVDESILYLYSNGVLYESVAAVKTKLGGILLGCINSSSGNWFKGTLDDIRFYNSALTANQIQILYTENGWSGN